MTIGKDTRGVAIVQQTALAIRIGGIALKDETIVTDRSSGTPRIGTNQLRLTLLTLGGLKANGLFRTQTVGAFPSRDRHGVVRDLTRRRDGTTRALVALVVQNVNVRLRLSPSLTHE